MNRRTFFAKITASAVVAAAVPAVIASSPALGPPYLTDQEIGFLAVEIENKIRKRAHIRTITEAQGNELILHLREKAFLEKPRIPVPKSVHPGRVVRRRL